MGFLSSFGFHIPKETTEKAIETNPGLVYERTKTSTLEEILENPKKHFSGWNAYHEIFVQTDFSDCFEGNPRKRRLTDLGVFLGFVSTTVPHELMHAYANIATGGANKEIGFNKFFLGDLTSMLVPDSVAEWHMPFVGAWVEIAEYGSLAGQYATGLLPYALTPVGIYLLEKGKEKKNAFMASVGAGTLVGHVGGILGDWFSLGRATMYQSVEYLNQLTGTNMEDLPTAVQAFAGAGVLWGGFWLGAKTMAGTYQVSKALVRNTRNWFRRKTSTEEIPQSQYLEKIALDSPVIISEEEPIEVSVTEIYRERKSNPRTFYKIRIGAESNFTSQLVEDTENLPVPEFLERLKLTHAN